MDLIKWIKRNDNDQHKWAINYLHKRNFSFSPYHSTPPVPPNTYEYLIELESNFKTNPHYLLAVRTMKSAWRQKKLRKKRAGKTEFSLVISNEKKKKLSTLAQQRGKTLGEALEEIINYESQRQIEVKEELKKEKELMKQKLELAKVSYNARAYKKDMTIHALLYLLEENIANMLQSEIDAIKAYQPTAYEHTGTKEYEESRLEEEKEKINNALKTIHSWEPTYFPLGIIEKLNIKKYINDHL